MARAIQQDASGTYVEIGDADTLNVGLVQLQAGIAADAILDEDNLGSDSDTAVPTQQSVKTYVDGAVKKAQAVAVPMGVSVVDTFPDISADAVVWHYVIKNGANMRAGTITSCWESGMNAVVMNETSTADIGITTGVTFQVAIVILTNMVELRVTTPGAGWTVLVDRLRLYMM
jgi:hypothetical protein